VGKRKENKKDMIKVKLFACHKTNHYASQCSNKKKKKQEPEVLASVEVDDFTEKFEKEFSLMTGPSGIHCPLFEEIEALFMESGASHHMMGMRFVFLSLS
jgi:hypothetical protein